MFGLSGTEVLLILTVGLGSYIIPLVGIVLAAVLPDSAWAAAGKNKAVWIALQVVFTLVCGPAGAVFALIYLFGVHPQVKAHSHPGSSIPPARAG